MIVVKHGLLSFYRYVGDCQMNLALKRFIEEKGAELIEKNLFRNFVLHCCNLFEFGVIGPPSVFMSISRMPKLLQEQSPASRVSQDWLMQRTSWMLENDLKPAASKPAEKRKDFSGIFKNDLVNSKPADGEDTQQKEPETKLNNKCTEPPASPKPKPAVTESDNPTASKPEATKTETASLGNRIVTTNSKPAAADSVKGPLANGESSKEAEKKQQQVIINTSTSLTAAAAAAAASSSTAITTSSTSSQKPS